MYQHQPVTLASLLLIPAIGTTILNSLPSSAYIPAQPVNDTSSLNLTDASTISIQWVDPGRIPVVFSGPVSYQLEADVRTGGTTRGALVHFTESTAGANLSTSTPWIAYISCDLNETTASEEWDIFTLARDRGAVSALLYTTTAESCLLNQEYVQDFEKPLDVFATKTRQTARVIDSQFNNTEANFSTYNGAMLNTSGMAVNMSLMGTPLANQTYLTGTLTAQNSSGQATTTGSIPYTGSSGNDNAAKLPAGMIAVYAIVGVVSGIILLFLICGFRRFVAHPERYGRRAGEEGQGGHSRASGVAQALLDTFPVVKFSRNDRYDEESERRGGQAKKLSSHGGLSLIAMPVLNGEDRRAEGHGRERKPTPPRSDSSLSDLTWKEGGHRDQDEIPALEQGKGSPHRIEATQTALRDPVASGSSSTRTSGLSPTSTPLPEITTDDSSEEHCPICLLEFETGDDVRVLPCEREHRYHQACIDPWLLDVSSSCPLCRKDFNNPTSSSTSPDEPSSPTTSQPPTAKGFAKYMAFMRRERGVTGRTRQRRDSRGEEMRPRRRREADQTGPGGY